MHQQNTPLNHVSTCMPHDIYYLDLIVRGKLKQTVDVKSEVTCIVGKLIDVVSKKNKEPR